jgi:hypothetical protein
VESEKYAVRVLPLFAFESEKKIVGMGSIEVFRHPIMGLGRQPHDAQGHIHPKG